MAEPESGHPPAANTPRRATAAALDLTRALARMELQDMAPLAAELEQGVHLGQYTAWSCASSRRAVSFFYADEAHPCQGSLAEPTGPFHPAFDLASLTKPLFTNLLLRRVLQGEPLEGRWSAPLRTWLTPRTPETALLCEYLSKHSHDLSLLNLLNHTSGARPWFWFGRGKWAFKAGAAQSPGMARAQWDHLPPGELALRVSAQITQSCLEALAPKVDNTVIYSDLNYFLLARILESLFVQGGTPGGSGSYKGQLLTLWQENLSMLNSDLGTGFFHASLTPALSAYAIPYFPYIANAHSDDSGSWLTTGGSMGTGSEGGGSGGLLPVPGFGPVHDTNANILASLGGARDRIVSGHAGLFGNILDVGRAVRELAAFQVRLMAERRVSNEAPPPRFVFGLDTPGGPESLAGLKSWPLPPHTHIFGHLGYTGTSAWFALPKEENSLKIENLEQALLLTNRTSHRLQFGTEKSVRLAVVSRIGSPVPNSEVFVVQGNGGQGSDLKLLPVTEDDAFELLHTQFYGVEKVWDANRLCVANDIAALRRAAGRALWPY